MKSYTLDITKEQKEVIQKVIDTNESMIVAQLSNDGKLVAAAWSAAFEKYTDELLSLMRGCK